MKRCPQCQFIYEDDQSLCDMDGVLLVFDAQSLPNLHALAPVRALAISRAHWRHRTYPAMAALILASVLSLAYFVSTQRPKPIVTPGPATAPMPISGTSLTNPPNGTATTVAPDTNQTPPPPVTSEANAATTKEETKSDPRKAARPAAKKAVVQTSTTQRQPEEPKKEDSRVGSILKKTGRLLKKPFKL